MKALSIKQPWAELILSGKKTIECRSWHPKDMVGRIFLIHASATIDRALNEEVYSRVPLFSRLLPSRGECRLWS